MFGSECLLMNKEKVRVLTRAKYYLGDLISTVFPSDALPTWKSIEHGLTLMRKGIIRRVGLGTKIQIWIDPWIPRPPSLRISLKKG
jgi:hypothetical protein